jgi:hypothetical protein
VVIRPAALVLALACAPPSLALADACPDELPSDEEVQARLAWIERRIENDEDDVRRWFTGVLVFHAALAGANLALALSTPDDQNRIDFIVTTAGSSLGLVTLLATTPPILGAGDSLRSLPRSTATERYVALRIAEERLRRSASASSFVRGEVASLLSLAYIEAASLTLLFLGRYVTSIIHAIGGTLIGQGRLLLHPTGSIDAWRAYAAAHPDAGCSPLARYDPGVRLAIAPSAGPNGAGLSLQLVF